MADVDQVFVVTSGCYSDYCILSVWLTRAEAEAAAGDDDHDGYGTRVEVYGIGEGTRRLGSFHRYADVDPRTGAVTNETSGDGPSLEDARAAVCWRPNGNGTGTLLIRVEQETQERADKVYSEVKAQVVAALDRGLSPRAIATTELVGGAWRPIDPATVQP